MYEYLKAKSISYTGRSNVNFPISFACGALSGTVASVVTHPFDVGKSFKLNLLCVVSNNSIKIVIVKTHRQITLGQTRRTIKGKKCSIGSMSANKSMSTVIREIVRTDGMSGLFAG